MLGNERLQLGDDLAMPAKAQVGLDPVLENTQAQLFEPMGLTPQRVRREASQGRAAPKRECLSQ